MVWTEQELEFVAGFEQVQTGDDVWTGAFPVCSETTGDIWEARGPNVQPLQPNAACFERDTF